MKANQLKWTLQDIIEFLQSPVISKKTILIRAGELRKELQQIKDSGEARKKNALWLINKLLEDW